MLAALSCGDDDAGTRPADAGTESATPQQDAGTDTADAGPRNTCLAPDVQHLPCCWESSNAERDVLQFAARGASFTAPESFANEVFRTTIQEGLDGADGGEPNFMLLVRATPMGGTRYRVEVGFGCRSSRREPFQFSRSGVCGAPDDRWTPLAGLGSIVDDVLSTELVDRPLVVPLPAAGDPFPELRFHAARIVRAPLTEGRTCIGARTPNRRWSYGELGAESEIEGYFRVDEARATAVPSLDGMSMCELVARTACDQPRAEWDVQPDARCEGEVCVAGECVPESEDPLTGCNAWRIGLRAAAAGVDIE